MLDVYDVETGATLRRSPVDAREMVASGQYSMTPPAVASDEPPAGDPINVPVGPPVGEMAAPKRKR